MYKLIVADDEEFIRQGIIHAVPWRELGFEVVGEAVDGEDAIYKIKSSSPDVILVDLKMPKMNGIELIEYVNNHYPQLKVVILSGHSEIEYLLKAIKHKVHDYLIKPTRYDEFIKVFNNLKTTLDTEKKREKEIEKLLDSLPHMRIKFLDDLVNGFYTDEKQIQDKAEFYEIKLKAGNHAVCVLEVDSLFKLECNYAKKYDHLLRFKVVDIANKCVKELGLGMFYLGNNTNIIGILNFEYGIVKITEAIQKVQKAVFKDKDVTISVGIGNVYLNLYDIKISYWQALEALKQKVFLGQESLIFYKDIQTVQDDTIEEYKYTFDYEKIIDTIFYDLGSKENKLHLLLDEIFRHFEKRIVKKCNYIDELCLELLFNISRCAMQFNISVESILNKKKTDYTDIFKMDSLYLKEKWLLEILLEVSQRIKELRSDNCGRIVREVKEYTKDHFFDNSLSLVDVSNKVGKNSAYVSKIFKLETGENFIDYVTRIRMENAKMYFRQARYKVYDVSNMVGYADCSHFTRNFKKYTGYSPSKYRELQ